MTTWEERFRRRQRPEPRLDLLEVVWRFVGPSRRVLACGIYSVDTGLEVRARYSTDDVVHMQLVPEIGSARELAEQWRQAVIAKGSFEELPTA